MKALLARTLEITWDEWAILFVPLAVFGTVVAGLLRRGTTQASAWWARPVERIASVLERNTPVPAWAGVSIGVGLFGLMLAVIGFYWDVAWHIDFGRDQQLLTPAHTAILAGLALLAGAGLAGTIFATVGRVDTRLKVGSLSVPFTALALLALGGGAVVGFPLDELWHRAYGIDVTMWSPTHLIMIVGAALSPIALWLVLAEAGVRPGGGLIARTLHGTMAAATLTGLSAIQAEFDFGVPQFQLLYQPVLIAIAAAGGLVAARTALGPFGALRAVLGFLAIRSVIALLLGGVLGLTVPRFPLYLASAVVVEVTALLLGTANPARLALISGIGVTAVGLAAEWVWMASWGRHAWTSSMLPAAFAVAAVGAVGAAFLGSRLGFALRGDSAAFRVRRVAGLIAVLALVCAVLIPLPRTTSNVLGEMTLESIGDSALVRVRLDPPDAARQARWFEVMAWQGGALVISPMREEAPGRYSAETPVPVTGPWKTLLRLHHGSDLLSLPVYMPADEQIGAPGIRAVDRAGRFVRDSTLLVREAHDGPAWPAAVAYGSLAALVAAWFAVLARAAQQKACPRNISHP